MWDAVTAEEGTGHEQALRTIFQPAFDQQASLVRHDNTDTSVHRILGTIFKNHPMALIIQREIVDDRKELWNTSAGGELKNQLEELARMFEKLPNDSTKFQEANARLSKIQRNLQILTSKEKAQELFEAEPERRTLPAQPMDKG
jgi:hypothetical protein